MARSWVSAKLRVCRPASRGLAVYVCLTVAILLCHASSEAVAGFPISVRFVGKIYLTPSGEKGRHRDLLPLALEDGHMVYLQVDSFHTANKDQGELTLFSDMQRRRYPVRVINSATVTALLTADTLRGKRVALNGFFYRTSGLLWVAAAHLKE
ncbi:MAG: hypothetical protein AB1671_15535 [Thermodesulfobacteriota bacterium]